MQFYKRAQINFGDPTLYLTSGENNLRDHLADVNLSFPKKTFIGANLEKKSHGAHVVSQNRIWRGLPIRCVEVGGGGYQQLALTPNRIRIIITESAPGGGWCRGCKGQGHSV